MLQVTPISIKAVTSPGALNQFNHRLGSGDCPAMGPTKWDLKNGEKLRWFPQPILVSATQNMDLTFKNLGLTWFNMILNKKSDINRFVAPKIRMIKVTRDDFWVGLVKKIKPTINGMGSTNPWYFVVIHDLPSGKQPHNELENHHFYWANQLFLWPFSIAFCMFTRGYGMFWMFRTHWTRDILSWFIGPMGWISVGCFGCLGPKKYRNTSSQVLIPGRSSKVKIL